MIYNNADNFEIIEYYHYPSYVQYVIANCKKQYGSNKVLGNHKIMRLFDVILEKAERISGRRLNDNKIAFKVRHIPSNTIFYIGYKDDIYNIGFGIDGTHPETITAK